MHQSLHVLHQHAITSNCTCPTYLSARVLYLTCCARRFCQLCSFPYQLLNLGFLYSDLQMHASQFTQLLYCVFNAILVTLKNKIWCRVITSLDWHMIIPILRISLRIPLYCSEVTSLTNANCIEQMISTYISGQI